MIKPSDIQAVIFDFDGTLAKLNINFSQMREDVGKLVSSFGISRNELPAGYVLETIRSVRDILMRHSRNAAQTFYEEAYAIIEEIEMAAAKKGELFESTRNLLSALRIRKISCGVVTRNCSQAVKAVFPDILSYCPVVVCRDDVKNVKPHPDHLNTALDKLGIPAANSLMIGDHPLDIAAGRNAGTATCGVLTGRCSKNDFIKAGADFIVPQAVDILDVIDSCRISSLIDR